MKLYTIEAYNCFDPSKNNRKSKETDMKISKSNIFWQAHFFFREVSDDIYKTVILCCPDLFFMTKKYAWLCMLLSIIMIIVKTSHIFF